MAAAKSMKSPSPAEASPDAKTRRAAQRPVTTRKRTPAKPAAAAPRKRTRSPKPSAPATPASTAAPAPAPAPKRNRALLGPAFYLSTLMVVVLAVAATGAFLLLQVDESSESLQAGVPATVSAETLATVATSDAPVYWAGPIPSRQLELTTGRTGTFLRYLPMAVLAGDPRATFTTIATYPLPDAYATAARRRTEPGMVSREMPGGGVAVWSRAQPTSVYLAYPRIPHLVEVYAVNPADARRLALSGQVRPAR